MSGTALFGKTPHRPGPQETQPLKPVGTAPPVGAAEEPVEDVLAGTSYRVIRKIDEGGMGTVYLAEHRDLGRRFAVKVIHPELSPTPELAERLRREARAASRIRHPGVVDVTDYGTTASGRSFVVMELIEGQTLGTLLAERKRLDQRQAVAVALKVCDALGAAHAGQVIHRDVKPDNVVLLDGNDVADRPIKVVDFGLALSEEHAGDRLTLQGMVFGTPEYMAPEQVRGQRVTPATDIYSLGVVLYEMLSGTLPFVAATPVETMATKLGGPPPMFEEVAPDVDVHPALEQVVFRCLEVAPEDRFASMAELADALAGALDELESGRPHVARPPVVEDAAGGEKATAAAELEERPPRRRVVLAAAVAVASFVVAAVAIALVAGRGDDLADVRAAAEGRTDVAAVPAGTGTRLEPPLAPPVEAPATSRADAAPAPVAAPGSAPLAARPDAGPQPAPGDARPPGEPGGSRADDRSRRAAALVAEGQQLFRRRQLGPARAAFEQALELGASSAEAQAGLGRIAFEEGRYGDAVTRLERALRSRPRDVGLRVVLGSAYLRSGDRSSAVAQWRRVLESDPDNAAARRALEGVGEHPPERDR
jgi:serine/threonine-protein kinase